MARLGCDMSEASAFLKSYINQPVKCRGLLKDGALPSGSSSSEELKVFPVDNSKGPSIVRARIPLNAVLPHFIGALKQRVVAAFCRQVGIPAHQLSVLTALRWLANLEYTYSEDGRKGIRAGTIAIYDYLGAAERVQDKGVGSGKVVTMSIGHYGLSSGLVRHFLEGVVFDVYKEYLARQRKRIEPGFYVRWRVELFRVHAFLEKDTDVH